MILVLYAVIMILYAILIIMLIYGYYQVPYFKTVSKQQHTTFSIIIPFRNEAENLPRLLKSIANQNYTNCLFELLLVDDDSSDKSLNIIKQFIEENPAIQTQVSQNKRTSASPKKDAIKTAIQFSQYDWIITIDADCVAPTQWLRTFDSFIQKNDIVMASGVVYPIPTNSTKYTLLNRFEAIDFCSLMASTIGGFGLQKPFLANGANLAYKKEAFVNVNGFDGNDHIASGDDIFLLHKLEKKYPAKLKFIKSKNIAVATAALEDWTSFFEQRKRWASKNKTTPHKNTQLIGTVVLLANLSTVVAYVSLVIHYFKFGLTLTTSFYLSCAIILLKYVLDFILIALAKRFMNTPLNLLWYPLAAMIYPLLTVLIIMLSFTQSYSWKDRVHQS